MLLYEREFAFPIVPGHRDLLRRLSLATANALPEGHTPIRVAITRTSRDAYHCEIGAIVGSPRPHAPSIFTFAPRGPENAEEFNAVFIVPTGVGAEIGGHAGDATPVARVLAAACTNFITHPNVVNASDINEIPENALYVEGSVLDRVLMGTAALQRVRANRVLVIGEAHSDSLFVNAAINSVSAARSSYGLNCAGYVHLDPPVRLRSQYASSGRAVGKIRGFESLCSLIDRHRDLCDAVAITSVIEVPSEFHGQYFEMGGAMVNPWGGVEAMLTHAVSSLYDLPSAHAPMLESRAIANMDPGVVDPRMAAEAVSLTFIQCVLKGLHRSPRILTDPKTFGGRAVLSAADISCLVVPDGCLGLSTLAALEQGIPVIAVRENRNLMRNDLTELPWQSGQFHLVDNYWEAAGVMMAIKSGTAPESMRRPFAATPVAQLARPAVPDNGQTHLVAKNRSGRIGL